MDGRSRFLLLFPFFLNSSLAIRCFVSEVFTPGHNTTLNVSIVTSNLIIHKCALEVNFTDVATCDLRMRMTITDKSDKGFYNNENKGTEKPEQEEVPEFEETKRSTRKQSTTARKRTTTSPRTRKKRTNFPFRRRTTRAGVEIHDTTSTMEVVTGDLSTPQENSTILSTPKSTLTTTSLLETNTTTTSEKKNLTNSTTTSKLEMNSATTDSVEIRKTLETNDDEAQKLVDSIGLGSIGSFGSIGGAIGSKGSIGSVGSSETVGSIGSIGSIREILGNKSVEEVLNERRANADSFNFTHFNNGTPMMDLDRLAEVEPDNGKLEERRKKLCKTGVVGVLDKKCTKDVKVRLQYETLFEEIRGLLMKRRCHKEPLRALLSCMSSATNFASEVTDDILKRKGRSTTTADPLEANDKSVDGIGGAMAAFYPVIIVCTRDFCNRNMAFTRIRMKDDYELPKIKCIRKFKNRFLAVYRRGIAKISSVNETITDEQKSTEATVTTSTKEYVPPRKDVPEHISSDLICGLIIVFLIVCHLVRRGCRKCAQRRNANDIP